MPPGPAGRRIRPSPSAWRSGHALAGFLGALELGPAHVLGLSWGGSLALELFSRHPEAAASLILADTYAGWKGSLPAAECAERLDMALHTSTMPPDELVSRWLPELLSGAASPELAHELASIMSDFHPVGLRLMAHAMADADLRNVLPEIQVPRPRFRPDTRLDRGGLHVESHGGSDGGRWGGSLRRTE